MFNIFNDYFKESAKNIAKYYKQFIVIFIIFLLIQESADISYFITKSAISIKRTQVVLNVLLLLFSIKMSILILENKLTVLGIFKTSLKQIIYFIVTTFIIGSAIIPFLLLIPIITKNKVVGVIAVFTIALLLTVTFFMSLVVIIDKNLNPLKSILLNLKIVRKNFLKILFLFVINVMIFLLIIFSFDYLIHILKQIHLNNINQTITAKIIIGILEMIIINISVIIPCYTFSFIYYKNREISD